MLMWGGEERDEKRDKGEKEEKKAGYTHLRFWDCGVVVVFAG